MRKPYMIFPISGTGKIICTNCYDLIKRSYAEFLAEIIHNSKTHPPTIHYHKKVESPDKPSGKDIHP